MKKLFFPLLAVVLGLQGQAQNFTEENVTVKNPGAGINLAGTVTIPEGTPKAAIVLASGSGLQNRDEELFGHKPFKVLAETLSQNGYAVLRMDDRGFGESEGKDLVEKSTTRDFATDIASGLLFLDSCFAQVPKGVIGHSEGGSIAIMLASEENPKMDFLITLAGPAWSGDSIIMSQSRALSIGLTGKWEGEPIQRKSLDVAKSNMPTFQKQMLLYQIVAETLGEVAKMPEVQKSLNDQAALMVKTWYYEFLLYDPAEDIKKINLPWLALNGSKDIQVHPGNLDTFKDLNPKVTTVLLPDHNHLFQNCTTGLPQEYPMITEDISIQTLDAILHFLNSLY